MKTCTSATLNYNLRVPTRGKMYVKNYGTSIKMEITAREIKSRAIKILVYAPTVKGEHPSHDLN